MVRGGVGGLWHLVTEVCHSESSSSQAGHQCREASLLSLTPRTDASNHTDAVLSLLILPNQEPGRFSLDSTAAASLFLSLSLWFLHLHFDTVRLFLLLLAQ